MTKSRIFLKIIITIIISAILFYFSTLGNIRLTHDSHFYISAAKSFSISAELKNPDGSVFQHWPPLYPFILSFFLDNLSPFLFAFNFLCLMATVSIWNVIAHSYLDNSKVRIAFTLLLIFGVPLYLISKFAWSEPFFLVIFSLQILLFRKYVIYINIFNLISLAFLAVLLTLQRKAGVFLVFGLSLSVLAISYKLKGLRHFLIFIFIFLLYIPIWLAFLDFDTSAFFNTAHALEFSHVTTFFFDTLGSWIIPINLPLYVKLIIAAFLLLIMAFLSIKERFTHYAAYFLVFLTYFICMQFFEYSDNSETERYLSAVYPLFFLLFFKAVEIITKKYPIKINLILVFIFIWLAYPIFRTIKNIGEWYNQGIVR